MKKLLRSFSTLTAVALAGLCGLMGDAFAGDAVRILVEPPAGIDSLEPGQAIDVQVVGLDASGARVAFGGLRMEVSPADGSFTLAEAPYRYRYVAPAQIDAPRSVQLRAWLSRRPEVNGSATIRLAPRRTYNRLVLRGPAVVEFGSAVTIDVLATFVLFRGALQAEAHGPQQFTDQRRSDLEPLGSQRVRQFTR